LEMRNLIMFQKLCIEQWQKHAIAWSIPLIPSLLPLAGGLGISSDDDDGGGLRVCAYGNGHVRARIIWMLATQTVIILLCIAFMLLIVARVRRYLKKSNIPADSIEVSLCRTLVLYPMSMVVIASPILVWMLINGVSKREKKRRYYGKGLWVRDGEALMIEKEKKKGV